MKAIEVLERQLTVEQIYQKQRDFQLAIQPLIKVIANVTSLGMPRLIVENGQVVSYETVFTPEQQEIIDNCRRLIDEIAESFNHGDSLWPR